MKLWDFQKTAIEDTRAAFRKNKRVVLSMPTGSGKTVVALMAVKSALEKGRTVAFVCDRLTLLDQTANFMFKQGLDFGIVQGDNPLTDFGKQFQICSAQTLAKRKKQYFDFYIIDECHIIFWSRATSSSVLSCIISPSSLLQVFICFSPSISLTPQPCQK